MYRRHWVWVCTVGKRTVVVYCIRVWLCLCTVLKEGVAVGLYSISSIVLAEKNEWLCTLFTEEVMSVGVYSISGRERGFW